MLHGRTSSHIEDGAIGGLEMIGMQPAHAQVEYHHHHHHHQDPAEFSSPPTSPDVPSCTVTFEEVDIERQPLNVNEEEDDNLINVKRDTRKSPTELDGTKEEDGQSAADSLDSAHSTDSDANELQSLMPKSHEKDKTDKDESTA